MAEQEMKSGANTGGSNVVVMEQSAGSRHKQPYRPTELQDEASDLHHKRSRAPAVPSVAEELKTLSEDTGNEIVDAKDGKENERGIPSEKYKHNVAKKLSSNTKKRANLPDSIEVEVRKAVMTPPPQPIPAQVETVASASGISMQDKHASEEEKKADEDSITEETDELRTAAETKHSEWDCDPQERKKREVTWENEEYLQKIHLKEIIDADNAVRLERKTSVGPCRSKTLYEGPSGIFLWVPKKSSRIDAYPDLSGINITISKHQVPKSRPGSATGKQILLVEHEDRRNETKAVKVDPHIPYGKMFSSLKGKYDFMRSKIKNVLRI